MIIILVALVMLDLIGLTLGVNLGHMSPASFEWSRVHFTPSDICPLILSVVMLNHCFTHVRAGIRGRIAARISETCGGISVVRKKYTTS